MHNLNHFQADLLFREFARYKNVNEMSGLSYDGMDGLGDGVTA